MVTEDFFLLRRWSPYSFLFTSLVSRVGHKLPATFEFEMNDDNGDMCALMALFLYEDGSGEAKIYGGFYDRCGKFVETGPPVDIYIDESFVEQFDLINYFFNFYEERKSR